MYLRAWFVFEAIILQHQFYHWNIIILFIFYESFLLAIVVTCMRHRLTWLPFWVIKLFVNQRVLICTEYRYLLWISFLISHWNFMFSSKKIFPVQCFKSAFNVIADFLFRLSCFHHSMRIEFVHRGITCTFWRHNQHRKFILLWYDLLLSNNKRIIGIDGLHFLNLFLLGLFLSKCFDPFFFLHKLLFLITEKWQESVYDKNLYRISIIEKKMLIYFIGNIIGNECT